MDIKVARRSLDRFKRIARRRYPLENCGNNLPTVTGSQVVVPATLTMVPNVAGNLVGTIVGNDIVTCGTTIGQTYYQVTIFSGTQQVYQNNYSITGPAWNLDTANPLSNDPTAFLNYTGYLLGDMIYGAGTNTLGLIQPLTVSAVLLKAWKSLSANWATP